MRKKLIALGLAILTAASLLAPAAAITPRYQPVSQQGWYLSLQKNLGNLKTSVSVSQGALNAAAKAGAEAGKEAAKLLLGE